MFNIHPRLSSVVIFIPNCDIHGGWDRLRVGSKALINEPQNSPTLWVVFVTSSSADKNGKLGS